MELKLFIEQECLLLAPLAITNPALAAGEHRRVEDEMAQRVERVGVRLACLGGDLRENNAALGCSRTAMPRAAVRSSCSRFCTSQPAAVRLASISRRAFCSGVSDMQN